MPEKLSPIRFLIDAFKDEFGSVDKGRRQADKYPLSIPEKVGMVLKTFLSRKEYQQFLRRFNSLNYGIYLSYSVFPKFENPDEFHSRNGVVALNEHPVQVIGSREYEQRIEDGVKEGLDKRYIELGFDREAEKRGIDLEWSFFSEVPGQPQPSVDHSPLLPTNTTSYPPAPELT